MRIDRQLSEARGLLPFLIPVAVEQLFLMVIGMVITLLAARLGPAAVSAIGSVNMVNAIVISTFQIIAVGATIVVAQAIGRGDRQDANRAAAQALLATAVLAVTVTGLLAVFRSFLVDRLFGSAEPEVLRLIHVYWTGVVFYYPAIALTTTAYGVLRGAGNMRLPMTVSILMHLAHMLLAALLMYGIPVGSRRLFAWGVTGAAVALVLANTLGAALILRRLVRGTRQLRLVRRDLRPDRTVLSRIFRLGIPGGGEQIVFNGGKLVIQTLMMGLGTAALAANSITNALVAVLIVVPNSVPIVATTLVGQFVGRGDPEGARRLLFRLTVMASVLIALTALVAYPFSRQMLGLFTDDPATLAEALRILKIYYLFMPIQPFAFTMASGLRGAGDVTFTMIVSVLATWAVRVVFTLVLIRGLHLGVAAVWFAMYADWIVRAVIFTLRAKGRRWLRSA